MLRLAAPDIGELKTSGRDFDFGFDAAPRSFRAASRSWLVCRAIQNSAEVPKNRPNRSAVSGVIGWSPWIIS